MDDPEITRAWSFLWETVRSYRPAWEEALVEHARLVHDLSMEIARLLTAQGRSVDRRILALGAILHDVGRSRARRLVEHGIKSGEILREQGFPEAAARLAETHVGVGIHPEQAASLGLPPGDYIPRTLEERIACYADNLLAYLPEEGRHEIGDAEAAAERFSREVGPEYGEEARAFMKGLEAELGPAAVAAFRAYVDDLNRRLREAATRGHAP